MLQIPLLLAFLESNDVTVECLDSGVAVCMVVFDEQLSHFLDLVHAWQKYKDVTSCGFETFDDQVSAHLEQVLHVLRGHDPAT